MGQMLVLPLGSTQWSLVSQKFQVLGQEEEVLLLPPCLGEVSILLSTKICSAPQPGDNH